MRRILLIGLALASTGWGGACSDVPVSTEPASQAVWVRSVLEPGLVDGPRLPLSADARRIARFGRASLSEEEDSEGEEVLEAFGRGYDVPLPETSLTAEGTYDPADVARWTAEAAAEIAAYGILVVDRPGGDDVLHAAVYWRSPLASRVRVVRIRDDGDGTVLDRERVLNELGTCAVSVDEWISAPETLAEEFLTSQVSASMLVVAPEGRSPGGEWVPPERVIDALRFEDPATENLDAFSAWFAGERPSVWAVTRLIPTLRSSLGPRDLFDLFRTAR